jgi:BlaI family penicillinase repressor
MAKRRRARRLSDWQLRILRVIWERGEASVLEVWEALSAERPVARNTVQTMMVRLEKKGWLRHRAEGQSFFYRAAKPQSATLGNLVRDLVDVAFAGSAEGLVMALLDGRGVTAEEAARIRRMIREAERET